MDREMNLLGTISNALNLANTIAANRRSEDITRCLESLGVALQSAANVVVSTTRNSVHSLTADEMALARTPGRKIEAIRNTRARTGLGLKEAKELVEKWMNENGIPLYTPRF